MIEYNIIDVPQNNPCDDCNPCLRLRLLDMGFIPGQHIEVEETRFGLVLVHFKSDIGIHEQTIALRPEEFNRLCLIPS
jgi:Fe2+ transport system protein FeoA